MKICFSVALLINQSKLKACSYCHRPQEKLLKSVVSCQSKRERLRLCCTWVQPRTLKLTVLTQFTILLQCESKKQTKKAHKQNKNRIFPIVIFFFFLLNLVCISENCHFPFMFTLHNEVAFCHIKPLKRTKLCLGGNKFRDQLLGVTLFSFSCFSL